MKDKTILRVLGIIICFFLTVYKACAGEPPEKNWPLLYEQTYTILGLSVVTASAMTLLPESVTNWDSDDRNFRHLTRKWQENVKNGPVWDDDDPILNYVMHPYFGGVYYTVGRHSGLSPLESALYSFTMSTFFGNMASKHLQKCPHGRILLSPP